MVTHNMQQAVRISDNTAFFLLGELIEFGKTEEIFLPKSNVLYFELEDKNNFIVRPSGTEPKIKLYCLLQGKTPDETSEIAKLLAKLNG